MQIDFRHRDVNGGNRGFVIVFVWQIVRVRQIKKHYARFDDFSWLSRRYETFIGWCGVSWWSTWGTCQVILVSFWDEHRVVDLKKAVSASVIRQKSKWGAKYQFSFFNEGRKPVESSMVNLQDMSWFSPLFKRIAHIMFIFNFKKIKYFYGTQNDPRFVRGLFVVKTFW